jgi:arabinogalactan endo-1,4-beta-galactosidase
VQVAIPSEFVCGKIQPTDIPGLTEVKALPNKGNRRFQSLSTVHYSDTLADPAVQIIPAAWKKNLSFTDLKAAVALYTATIMTEINPDIIQIGNEINSGLLCHKEI